MSYYEIQPNDEFWVGVINCPNCDAHLRLDSFPQYFDFTLDGGEKIRYHRHGSIFVPTDRPTKILVPYNELDVELGIFEMDSREDGDPDDN